MDSSQVFVASRPDRKRKEPTPKECVRLNVSLPLVIPQQVKVILPPVHTDEEILQMIRELYDA
jgi:hypothetical protein